MSETTGVVAAIDFGTYGAGFAWALRNDPAHTVCYEEDRPGAGPAYPQDRVVCVSMVFGRTEVVVRARDLNPDRELTTAIDPVTGG